MDEEDFYFYFFGKNLRYSKVTLNLKLISIRRECLRLKFSQ